MLNNCTILFPLVVALGVLLWILRWVKIHRAQTLHLNTAESVERDGQPEISQSGGDPDSSPSDGGPTLPEPDGDPVSSQSADRSMKKADWIAIALLTGVFAVIAYTGLGSTKAPQTFLHYEQGNTYAQLELEEPQIITRLRYYSGLCTADYTLQFSLDGENWTDQCKEDGTGGMTQEYTQLFRWNEASLNTDREKSRYIRIISGDEEYLGEVAVYGEDGQLISAEEITAAPGCEMLLDEQDVIPEAYSYKNGTYFDEIYFARTALEHIEERWPYEITHPPLGKMILSIGIRLFGMTPFGWRFMGTLFGVMMLPFFYLLLKRMFGSLAVAACGSSVLAFDFMHFTQPRLATIDSYAVFFIILMFFFMYLWLTEPLEHGGKRLLWLALSGASFGLGAASKWICIYAGGGLAVIWLIYWIVRFVREKKEVCREFFNNVGWCLLLFVLVPCAIYYCSYWAYGPSQGADGPFRLFTPEYLKVVLDNQKYMWEYHSDLVATHPYSSKWYQWLFDVRPILYYMENPSSEVTIRFGAFNNPIVSWGGLAAMVGMAWLAWRDKDERAVFILVGYLSNLLPWVLVSRLTFAYHYFPCTIFLVLAISYIFADLRKLDRKWKLSVGGFTGAEVGLFCLFYPVLAGTPVSTQYCRVFLRWFTDTWPF